MRTMFGSTSCNYPSRFLEEIPSDLLEGYDDAFGTSKIKKNLLEDSKYSWSYGNSNSSSPIKSYNIKDTIDKGVAVASNIFGKQASFGRSAESFLSSLSNKGKKEIDLSQYGEGVRIFHKKFGEGTITKTEPEGEDLKVDIEFDKVGHKRLMAKFANLEIL